MVVVKVAPEDVVAVPPDYNNTKMRICRGEVLSEITEEDDPEYFGSLVYNRDDSECFCYTADDEDYDKSVCPECGADIDESDCYCRECGQDLV